MAVKRGEKNNMKDANPILLAEELNEVLQRYIATTLPISRRYPKLSAQFRTELANQTLVAGPYVEAVPDFEKGASLEELLTQNGGFLHPAMAKIPTASRKLHKHQQRALELAGKDGKSLLVATGTGSGKTETFLYPIAHHLLSDPEPDKPGVRALLVYPMNALANDQLYYRIAPLFGDYLRGHNITFGRYTGQVKASAKRDEEEIRIYNNPKLMQALGDPPKIPLNWLLTREEMLRDPPKILVTNYAMLEHLLLLPRNERLFVANALRFIVLDEIHTYHGAQATEVAFLLRKLKNRLGIEKPLQVFGTSATLADGEGADIHLKHFAGELFGEEIHEVIRGKRIVHERLQAPTDKEFTLSAGEWCLVGSVLEDLMKQRKEERTTELWNLYLDKAGLECAGLKGPETLQFPQFLEERFSANHEIRKVARRLDSAGIQHFKELATYVFDAPSDCAVDDQRYKAISAIIRVGMLARGDGDAFPLLPGRYHIAVNSIEGLAVLPSVEEEGWASIVAARHYRNNDGIHYPLLICRKCGQPFIEGYDDGHVLHNRRPDGSDVKAERKVFWLGKPISHVEDEDDETEQVEVGEAARCWVDIKTGNMIATETSVPLYAINTEKDEEEKIRYVNKCPACGGRASGTEAEVVTRMHPGNEALGSVVAQRILESLPPNIVDNSDPRPAMGRNLLAFSDNRQDAAFFAPYFERTSGDLALRSAIRNVFKERSSTLTAPQLADKIYQHWNEGGQLPILVDGSGEQITDRQDVIKELLARIGFEFCTPGGRRNSLEALGVVTITYDGAKLKMLIQKTQQFWPLGLPNDESSVKALVHLLLESFRRERALSKFHGVGLCDSHVWQTYNQHRSFDIEGGEDNVLYKWLPNQSQNRYNRRTWYLVEQLGVSKDVAFTFLRQFWEAMVKPPVSILERHPPGFALNGDLIRFENGERAQLHVCQSCGLLQHHVLNRKCSAFKCKGEVKALTPEDRAEFKLRNHYLFSYEEPNHTTVTAKEHTASLSTELRERIEQDFADRRLNLLSCTTTMEMGVDLGDLEAVINLNVPPGIANYQQRTGRAGRRTQAAPFCITIARNTNFDQAVFRDFSAYLASSPTTPFVYLENQELFKRHQFSVLLSHFLRQRIADESVKAPSLSDMFGEVFGQEALQEFTESLQRWTEGSEGAAAIYEAEKLTDRLPEAIRTMGAKGLVLRNQFLAAIREFGEEVCERYGKYTDKMEEASGAQNFKQASSWQGMRRDFMGQFLVNQLSQRGLIPTYSFPVHSLNLEVLQSGGKWQRDSPDIVLSRDASLGISEYAPGGEVVANGRIWESAGLAFYPRTFMPDRWYVACPVCFNVDIGDTSDDIRASCSNCGSTGNRRKRLFVEPRGFVTSYDKARGRDPSSSRRRARPADEARLIAAPREEQFEETGLPFMATALLSARGADEDKPEGVLFIANRGTYGEGYQRCSRCNFATPKAPAQPEIDLTKKKVAAKKFKHRDPMTGEYCVNDAAPTIGLDLVHRFQTDIRLLRFIATLPEPVNAEISARGFHERFARTMSEAVRLAATDMLGLYPGELRAIFRLYGVSGNRIEVVLYDGIPGGAGYCARLGDAGFSFTKLLTRARERLNCPAHCDSGCRVCLCDYGNQRYWDSFERKAVLAWLVELMEPSSEGSSSGAFVLWNSPSLAGLAERLENFPAIHLTTNSLVGNVLSEEALGQLISWMQAGKTVHVYLANPLDSKPSTRAALTVYRRLHPYAMERRLRLYCLPKKADFTWETLPRVFAGIDIDRPMFRQRYALQPLAESIISAAVDLGKIDEESRSLLGDFIRKVMPCADNALEEGDRMQMWEFARGQARNFDDMFSVIVGQYVKEIALRDPYCGACKHQGKLAGFLKILVSKPGIIKSISVKCKEVTGRDGEVEFYLDIQRHVDDVIRGLGIEKRTIDVFRLGDKRKFFHDRELDITVTTEDGCDVVHRYFLTGGIDLLMNPAVETKVFYIRLDK